MSYNLRSALKVRKIYSHITEELTSRKIYGCRLVLLRSRALRRLVEDGTLSPKDIAHWFRFNKVT